MDRTVRIAPTHDRRRLSRHKRAWERFSPDGNCPYCGHGYTEHGLQVGQPHFFRLATDVERSDPSVRIYRDPDNPDADGPRYRRVVVSKYAEVVIACCLTCADEKSVPQVVCYQVKTAIGEVVGGNASPGSALD